MLTGNSLTLDLPWLITALLVSVRLAAVLLMTPILTAAAVPKMARVLIVFVLAIALTLGFPQFRTQDVPELGAFIIAVLTELALGGTLALGVLVALAAFSVAGRLLDIQIGYGIGQVFDPITRRQLPILTTVFNQLATATFFASNAHHSLLRGFAYSLERFPPGRPWALDVPADPLIKHVASLLSLGFALAAPVVFCILLVEFAMGVLTRNLPQMHMFALAIPLKIGIGMAALGFWFIGSNAVMPRIYTSAFQTWNAIFQ